MNHALLPTTHDAQLPEKYEAAKIAILECSHIDECKDWADKSQALASYARQSNDKEMETTAQRIRARAIRRCGELLKDIEKATNQHDAASRDTPTRKTAAEQAGMSKDQAVQSIRVANVPEESFEAQLESDKPPTITALADQGKQPSKAKPMYEQLGMTKEAFQAGTAYIGAIAWYAKSIKDLSIADIVNGTTEKERAKVRTFINQVDLFHDKLIAKI